jgi:hypothetical protein
MKTFEYKMNRQNMLSMLMAFDEELDKPLTIVITGASALIIRNIVIRQSGDIDILRASEDINAPKLHEMILKLSERFSLPPAWMNDDAKKTLELLPKEYKFDLIKVEGDFKKLLPYVISTPDSVISKLVLFENIRPWDVSDIMALNFTELEIAAVKSKLEFIHRKDPALSLNIEIAFKKIRPDLVLTKEGFSFSTVKEVAEYAKSRYKLRISKNRLDVWDSAIKNMETTFPKIIVEIDSMALAKNNQNEKNYELEL